MHCVKYCVDETKDGTDSASLSMAYSESGNEFALKVLRALKGETGVVAPSFVHLSADSEGGERVRKELGEEGLEYFSVPVEIGVCALCFLGVCVEFLTSFFLSFFQSEGVKKIHSLGPVTDKETALLKKAVETLKDNIVKASTFHTSPPSIQVF